jgi:hypothetical protein
MNYCTWTASCGAAMAKFSGSFTQTTLRMVSYLPSQRDKGGSQAERFKEAARQLGADESDDALDRAMDRLDLKAKPKPEGEKDNCPRHLTHHEARRESGNEQNAGCLDAGARLWRYGRLSAGTQLEKGA